MKYTINFDIRL